MINLLFPNTILHNWQMSAAERIALTGILARLRPKGALEVGVYYGGSLSLTSQFAQHIIGIDIDPQVRDRFECPANAEIWITDSETGIPQAYAHFDRSGIPVNFALVDADHSPAGIARDLQAILQYLPREPLVVLVHDSGNPGCRQGILSVDWASNPHCHEVDLDFVPGQIPEHSVRNGSGEIWGGFALAYFDPKPRVGHPVVRQSAATSLRCLRFLVDRLPPIGTISEADGEVRLERGVTLRPFSGLEKLLVEGWSAPEQWGIWSVGSRAVMRVAFSHQMLFPATILLDVAAFAPAGMPQSVTICIGNRTDKIVSLDPISDANTVPITIDRTDLSPDLRAEIDLVVANPASPASVGLSEDRRDLGIAVKLMQVV